MGQFFNVDTGFNMQGVQKIGQVFCGDIPGGTGHKRTPPHAGQGGIKVPNPVFQGRLDINQPQSLCIVEVKCHIQVAHHRAYLFHDGIDFSRIRHAGGIRQT